VVALLVVAVAVPTALAGRKPTDPKLTPRAADAKIARDLLLTKAEAGAGFAVQKQSSGGDTDCHGYKEPDLHLLTETAEVDGPELTNKALGATIATTASVFVSAGQAAKAFSTLKPRAFGNCLLAALKKHGMQNGHLTPLHVSVGGLELFAWDINGTLSAHGKTIPFETTVAGYRHSRALSMLMVTGPPTAVLEQRAKAVSERMARSILTAGL
jgi:hypothetical protein